jgi:hypothetical protein
LNDGQRSRRRLNKVAAKRGSELQIPAALIKSPNDRAQYAKLGIPLKQGNMDRINGWAEILQRLGDPGAGVRPTMFFHRCARLLECLPSLQHDPNRPEDVLKVDADEEGIGGDDAADACRYLVATKGRR